MDIGWIAALGAMWAALAALTLGLDRLAPAATRGGQAAPAAPDAARGATGARP